MKISKRTNAHMTRCLWLSSFLLILAFSTVLQADDDASANPALWLISDDDTTISLFGTMHIMRPGVNWMHGKVKSAFDDADELVLEALMLAPAEEQAIVMEMATDRTGQTLRSRLEGEDLARYESALQSLGIPIDAFDPFKPWLASVTLAVLPVMQAGYSIDAGVESVLTRAASTSSKIITGLESTREQLEFFNSVSVQLQLDMLNGTVQEIGSIMQIMQEMDSLWRNGQIEDLGVMVQAMMVGYGNNEQLTEILLTRRNKVWAEWVAQRMAEPGNVFMAVGAGHLAGTDNLRELLEAKGYNVERVSGKPAMVK